MKAFVPVLLLVLQVGVAAAVDITNVDGRIYSNVTVRRAEADGLVVATSRGIVKISFAELSPDVQRRFGHDPSNTATPPASPDLEDGGVQRAGDNEPLDPKAVQEMRRKGLVLSGRVQAVVTEGLILADGQQVFGQEGAGARRPPPQEMIPYFDSVPVAEEGGPVMILGASASAPGVRWQGRVFPCAAPFAYQPPRGAVTAIRCYAVTPEAALRHDRQP